MNPFKGIRSKYPWRVIRDWGWGISCRQNMDEFLDLLGLIGSPRIVLEIGTASGGTLALLHFFAAPIAKVVSVDLFGGAFGAGYPIWKKLIFKCFRQAGQKQVLIYGNSHHPNTLTKVRRAFGGEKVDLLFIDGDHTYLGVSSDFCDYGQLVRPGGMIVFHDIKPNCDSRYGVNRFWLEVKDRFRHIEIDHGGSGIGVIFK